MVMSCALSEKMCRPRTSGFGDSRVVEEDATGRGHKVTPAATEVQ